MSLAAAAKLRRSVLKDGRLGRAVAPKWLDCLKVESIDSRQIDLNAILRSWKSAGNRSRAIAIRVLFTSTPISAAFCSLFAGYSVKILCNKRKFPVVRSSFRRMRNGIAITTNRQPYFPAGLPGQSVVSSRIFPIVRLVARKIPSR